LKHLKERRCCYVVSLHITRKIS